MTTAQRFHAILRGFEGAHGTYEEEDFNPDKSKQEIKRTARTVRRPVTDDVWQAHLDGRRHLGVITICEDSRCWWGAVDVDDYDLDHRELTKQLVDLHLPGLVCRTKSGGAHVYVFFSEPVPASIVLPKLRDLAAVLGRGGSEVFPKQARLVTEDDGLGNWLNMPYFGGDQSKCYAVKPDGLGMSVEQFLKVAEQSRLSHREFVNLVFRKSTKGWEDAPPCLEYMAGLPNGIPQGQQNIAMFSFGVLAKKMMPEEGRWQELLVQWNDDFCRGQHDRARLNQIIHGLKKKDYNYKCRDVPCVSHCNMALCRTRKHGIGEQGAGVEAAIIESISYLDTDPPRFYVDLKISDTTVRCDGETLQSPGLFQLAVLNELKQMIPTYKRDVWTSQVGQALMSAMKIEAPPEVGRTGHFQELLEQFCTGRHVAEKRDELVSGKPWRDEEKGLVYFKGDGLMRHLELHKFKIGRGEVFEKIRSMGGDHWQFKIMGHCCKCWYVPAEKLEWVTGRLPLPDIEEGPV